jgi:antitoxin StbD
MNAPFVPEPIVPILADIGVSISDLKRNPAAVVEAARSKQVAILNRNKAVAYVVSPKLWESLLEMVEDYEDFKIVEERLGDLGTAIPVKIEDLV